MALAVKDGNGAGANVKSSLDTGAHVPHHNVDTLPSVFTTDTTAIKVAAQALAALISGARFPVDLASTPLANLATLAGAVTSSRLAVDVSTTIATYLSNLPTLATYLNTLQGAITSARMQVDLATTPTANLATLAGAVTSSIVQMAVPDVTASGTLQNVNDAVTVAMAGRPNAGFAIGAGFTGTLVFEFSYDGGSSWVIGLTLTPSTAPGTASTSVVGGSAINRALLVPAGASHVRVRVSVATSGSATGTIRATVAGFVQQLFQLPSSLGTKVASTSLGVTLASDDPSLTKLDTIATNQGVPSGGPKCGQNSSIGSGTDAQFGSQVLSRGMAITNLDSTNNLLVSHATGPTSTGSTTYVVKPNMSTPFVACSNATAVYMRSSAGTIAASYVGA